MEDKGELQDFEKAKANIKKLAEEDKANVTLSKSAEYDQHKLGFVKFNTEHHVSGTELNKVTSQVQDYFMVVQNWHEKNIELYKDLYLALEALDKGHIDKINATVSGLGRANEKIEDLLQLQESELKNLKNLKVKIDSIQHIDNVDDLWDFKGQIEKDMEQSKEQFEEMLRNMEKIDSLEKKQNDIQLEQNRINDDIHKKITAGEEEDKKQNQILKEQKEKDEEHDQLLKEQKQKDEEHDKLLKEQKEKDKEHDKLLLEYQLKQQEFDSKLTDMQMEKTRQKKMTTISIILSVLALVISLISFVL